MNSDTGPVTFAFQLAPFLISKATQLFLSENILNSTFELWHGTYKLLT